ncbi:hypothetical protein QBC40DRAFT_304515 [Triangularia verruculosa]|uniref:Uncharacterized protein n=1 Tax=Triangularia verruculosa TaxID=2587418 RepID=A0AAN6XM16_9PEZI|nr:hypothetical protein QBC40DRAFT_304515 [Triangularia verruculosa]
MAVISLDKKWTPGQRLKICFLDGSGTMQRMVQLYASDWQRYANLKFEYVRDVRNSDIRISFDSKHASRGGGSSWSCHEHQSPAAPEFVRWNEKAVQRDHSSKTSSYLKFNFFDVFPNYNLARTAFDPSSIMIYGIEPHWTLDGWSCPSPMRLSDMDKAFAAEQYPFQPEFSQRLRITGRRTSAESRGSEWSVGDYRFYVD